ncbi:MAG: tetratricopeptide (TPR) repeat protein [Bacteroidia bacterium]|jgi:tetratricopeptide (TPR) repeat protein
MKEVLIFFGKVIVNVILIFAAQLFHYNASDPILRITGDLHEPYALFFVPVLLFGLFISFKNKKIRPFGIGLTWLYMTCIIFLFLYINKSWASQGEYETFKLRQAEITENHCSLNIAFSQMYNSTEVSQDKCFDVDSVQVRKDNGFFGMKTMSDEVRIVESHNCETDIMDVTDTKERLLQVGDELFFKRCFSAAINHHSNVIDLHPNYGDCFYSRGEVFMATENYHKALNDYVRSAMLTYDELNELSIESIDKVKIGSYWEELLAKIVNNDYTDLAESVNKINEINGFDIHLARIKFCSEKVKARIFEE